MTNMSTIPCTIFWTCSHQRLLGCDYGLFSWHPCHDDVYTRCGFEGNFALGLIRAETKAIMSPDGQSLEMIQATFGDKVMAFEVIRRGFYGSITPGGLSCSDPTAEA